ncbi:hypothetical protein C8R48DRAFT_741724 [Suillus tomentosus]|nr:hypothetical protein C8R48DRAFT_741724 [Suillus tomentosus]
MCSDNIRASCYRHSTRQFQRVTIVLPRFVTLSELVDTRIPRQACSPPPPPETTYNH